MRTKLLAIVALVLVVFAANAQVASPELDSQLRRYEERLRAKATADQRPSVELFRQAQRAMADGKSSVAIEALEVLAGRTGGRANGGARTWLRLATAWEAHRAPLPRLPGESILAAYGSYRRAANDEERIEALSMLGNLLLRNTTVNPAGDPIQQTDKGAEATSTVATRRLALTVFVELGKLAATGSYRKQIERLSPPPFRLSEVQYPPPPQMGDGSLSRCQTPPSGRSTDQDSGQSGDDQVFPNEQVRCNDDLHDQVCLIFSRDVVPRPDDLKGKIFIERVSGDSKERSSDLPALVQGPRVCYANLRFGSLYRFTINKTLQSADGGAYEGFTTAYLTMPNYTPTLGFKRGTYVLPANSPQSVTMFTVNVDSAELKIRRIGDRNLFRELVVRHITNGLDRNATCFIIDEIGEKIADGNLRISGTPNLSAPYNLPIKEILDARRGWLPTSQPGDNHPFEKKEAAARLTLKLLGDAAATAASADHAGAFIVFGKIKNADLDDDDADTDAGRCPRGIASQWFTITNIGLTLQRSNAKIYVIARELDTGAPIADATIEFMSRSGLRLETARTDAHGMVEIPARLGRGSAGNALVAVMAYRERDYGFLDLTGDAIDLSDRGFDGRAKMNDTDAFIALGRDIYRPGETISALVLLRGPDGHAITSPPPFEVALVGGATEPVQRPNPGQKKQPAAKSTATVIRKSVINPAKADAKRASGGGFLVDLTLPTTMLEGSLKLEIRVSGQTVGSTDVDVRNFQPYTVRISPNLDTWSGQLSEAGVLTLRGAPVANYLYGRRTDGNASTDAPAANLRSELSVRVEAAASPSARCFNDFSFGKNKADMIARIVTGVTLPTDPAGRFEVDMTREGLSQSEVPLRASVRAALFDLNGKVVEENFHVPLPQEGRRWIGLKAGTITNAQVGMNVAFQYVALDERNQPMNAPLWISVFEEQASFEWSRDGGSWEFKRSATTQRRQVGKRYSVLPKPAPAGGMTDCPATSIISIPFERNGSYVVVITDDKGATTELPVTLGWTTAPDGSLRPDALRVLAKETYAANEAMDFTVETPHKAGRLLGELVVNGSVVHKFEADIESAGGATAGQVVIKGVRSEKAWPVGPMHIYVTSFRKSEDDSIEKGPGRAIGGTLVHIGEAGRRPTLEIRDPIRELMTMQLVDKKPIPIEIVAAEGLKANAWIRVAAIDEGILSVTNFETPNPHQHYFGRKRLDFDVFDNYGRILYGKLPEQLRMGGDLGAIRGVGYRSNEVVIWHSDVQQLSNGRVVVNLPASAIPATFQGQIRLMVWAWDADTVAATEHKFIVRDPIVMRVATPRFMSPGESVQMPLSLTNIWSPREVERIDVVMELSGPLELRDAGASSMQGKPCTADRSPRTCRQFTLEAPRKAPATTVSVPLTATDLPIPTASSADGTVKLSYVFGDRLTIERSWTVPVRLPHPRVSYAIAQAPIPAKSSREIGLRALQQAVGQRFDTKSVQLSVRLSRNALSAPAGETASAETQLRYLDQLASALQLLLAAQASEGGQPPGMNPPESEVLSRLSELVGEITALQQSDGGFTPASLSRRSAGERPPGGIPLTSVSETAFAVDVLLRAIASGVRVDDDIIERGIGFLLSRLRTVTRVQRTEGGCHLAEIYALSVLAKANAIGSSSFHTLAETCGGDLDGDDPAKRLMLAAAYGAFGHVDEARKLLSGDGDASGGLPRFPENPADAARAAALLLESSIDKLDPVALLKQAGLDGPIRGDNLTTASWFARAASAALAILEKERPAFRAADVSVTPASIIRKNLRDGVQLGPITLSETGFPPKGIHITNGSDLPLHTSLLANGVPLEIKGEVSKGLNVQVRRLGVEPAQTGTYKQYDIAYFAVEINQNDDYAPEQRLAVVQMLPSGFDGVDPSYQRSWSTVIGRLINPQALSEIEYVEFQDDRWIALPTLTGSREATRQQQHLLTFAVRPTFPGELVLPPLVVRDLNNPERMAWTTPQRITVLPAD